MCPRFGSAARDRRRQCALGPSVATMRGGSGWRLCASRPKLASAREFGARTGSLSRKHRAQGSTTLKTAPTASRIYLPQENLAASKASANKPSIWPSRAARQKSEEPEEPESCSSLSKTEKSKTKQNMINLASPAAYLVLLFAVAAARQQPTEGSQMSLAEGSSGVMQCKYPRRCVSLELCVTGQQLVESDSDSTRTGRTSRDFVRAARAANLGQFGPQ